METPHSKKRPRQDNRIDLALRLISSTLGAYALCWAVIAALSAWLPLAKASVWFLTGQLVPLPFVAVVLGAFATRNATRALVIPLTLAAAFQLVAELR